MENNKPLSIQVVLPRKDDYRKNEGGGSKTYMGECTPELRQLLISEFQSLLDYNQERFIEYPNVPCVGKVIMKDKAIAKSHKPTRLLSPDNCPIIGTGNLNEIYIKVTKSGVTHTVKEIQNPPAEDIKINLTKIDRIVPYTPEDIIEDPEIKKTIAQKNGKIEPLKIKLFDFQNDTDNRNNVQEFMALIKKLGLSQQLKELKYSSQMKVYKLICDNPQSLDKIINYSGIKQVSSFPKYYSALNETREVKTILKNPPQPQPGVDYPIIGVVDSGIKSGHKYLEPWIYKREVFVPEEYQNNGHGTFVAGVLEYGHILNDFGNRQTMYKILDVVALPNSDPNYGKVDTISEDGLLDIMEHVLETHSDKVKIWSLSLGTSKVCADDCMSDLAIALDEMQDRYHVEIIISAGNYQKIPLRTWPPATNIQDRITVPADSVRSLTVGSIAHKKGCGCVEINQPSPFSRRGPGPNFMIKPEVVDYGGNCSINGQFDGCGIISFDEDGNLIENIGTSFSTPRVTGNYGQIYYSLQTGFSSELSKALFIHSAKNPLSKKPVVREEADYLGFGIPSANLEDIIFCNQSSITMIFNAEILNGSYISMNNFPYPTSLKRNGKWFGEIKMTLVYRPPLDANFGQEYCRTNIEVSLGVYRYNKNGVLKYAGQVPPDVKWEERYESERVENGFKWSPIKSYHREIKNGVEGEYWRLLIECTSRSGENIDTQPFVLIVTINDLSGEDIYSEMINILRERGFAFYDLQVQDRVRNLYQL
jgi:serine protease AprX